MTSMSFQLWQDYELAINMKKYLETIRKFVRLLLVEKTEKKM